MTDIERMLREVINQQKEQELMDQRIWIVDLVLADQAALFRAIQEGRSTMVAEGKECCHDRPQISDNRLQGARAQRGREWVPAIAAIIEPTEYQGMTSKKAGPSRSCFHRIARRFKSYHHG
jgi:hypothetical protein